jgi:small subunit ribosomal protein S18
MAKKPQRGRGKPENPRKYKKKTSPLVIEKVEYVDYKDVDLLNRFMSDRAKIRNMRVSGNNRQQQLEIAKAIKISREMALLPYAKRVASTGRPGRGRDGGRDGDRDRRPPRDSGNDSQVEATNTEAADEAVAAEGAEQTVETVTEGSDAS